MVCLFYIINLLSHKSRVMVTTTDNHFKDMQTFLFILFMYIYGIKMTLNLNMAGGNMTFIYINQQEHWLGKNSILFWVPI